MKSNFKQLGQFICQVDKRNRELNVDRLLGVSINKVFIESIANTIGTDFSGYKIVHKGQFAYGPVTSRNGEKISIALLEEDECIISSAYIVFDIVDKKKLVPEYLMLWFSRPEFDRYSRYMSHGSVREQFSWDEMCKVELPVPSYEEQLEIVKRYQLVSERIEIKKKINDNLEDTARTLYKQTVTSKSESDLESVYAILKVINGAAFSSDLFNTDRIGYPLIRIRDLSSCNPDVYTSEALNNMEYISCGDILIGMDGEFIPHIWFGDVGVLNQRVCKVVPVEEYIHPLFLYWTLKPILAEIQRTQGGTTVIHVGKKDFDKMQVYHLSKEEHLDFTRKATPIFDQMLCNYQETLKLTQMQALLLSKLSR